MLSSLTCATRIICFNIISRDAIEWIQISAAAITYLYHKGHTMDACLLAPPAATAFKSKSTKEANAYQSAGPLASPHFSAREMVCVRLSIC